MTDGRSSTVKYSVVLFCKQNSVNILNLGKNAAGIDYRAGIGRRQTLNDLDEKVPPTTPGVRHCLCRLDSIFVEVARAIVLHCKIYISCLKSIV